MTSKYNKANIMKNAWNLRRTAGITMSAALKAAWARAKAIITAEEIAEDILNNHKIVVNDWAKGGHNRTYVEVRVYTNAWNVKRTHKVGYVNNLIGEFVAA